MKTIIELNNKVWYRLVKVIFLGLFILACVTALWNNYAQLGNYQDDHTVTCNYGNKSTFLAYKDKKILISSYHDYSKSLADLSPDANEEIRKVCDISDADVRTLLDKIYTGKDHGERLFSVTDTKVNIITYWSVISWSLVSILIITVVFEIIRRAFYYIVLGSIKPKKEIH